MENIITNQASQTSEKNIRSFLHNHVTAIDTLAGVLILLLVMTSVLFWNRYQQVRAELTLLQEKHLAVAVNDQVLTFTQLFIEKVLKAEAEIDFETRLKLESAVRELKDEEILLVWQEFTGSTSEQQAQAAVKNLLSALVAKIN